MIRSLCLVVLFATGAAFADGASLDDRFYRKGRLICGQGKCTELPEAPAVEHKGGEGWIIGGVIGGGIATATASMLGTIALRHGNLPDRDWHAAGIVGGL